jgi:hypothetical protein
MVTEFILTDVHPQNITPIIAPSTFFHIAQFLEPNSGLLPSLLRLRIIQADTYFACLHLLHTPSLKALEAINVPDHQHPTFFSFLTALVHRAPFLEDISLGPGRFPLKSLQAILKFTNLHRLELGDAASTIDFTFLQDIGALPNLESFILDARSCKYIARIPEEQFKTCPAEDTDSEVGNQTPKSSSDDGDEPSQGEGVRSSCLTDPTYEDNTEVANQTPRLSSDGSDEPSLGVGSPYPTSPTYEDSTEVRSKTPKCSSDIDDDEPSSRDVCSSPSEGFLVDADEPSRSVHPSLSCPSSPTLSISKDKEVDNPLQPICDQIPCDINSSTVGGFHQLKKFHFIGGLPLIQDMIPYIASSTLEDISITLIRVSLQDLKLEAEKEAEKMRQAEATERRCNAETETEQKMRNAEKEMKRIKATSPKKKWNQAQAEFESTRREILEKAKEQEAECEKVEERKKMERVQNLTQGTFDRHTALYITLLQTVSSRWLANLKTVKFNQLDGSFQPLSTLPKEVYGTLFRHPKIETLEFKRWKLDSVEDFIFSLTTSGPENLKHLHMPIDDPDSAVSLSRLSDIAEACPMLESLQCRINTLSPIPPYSSPPTKALTHGLQILSIVHDITSFWDFNQVLLVARHLYLAFPYIQTIDCKSFNADQWVRIHDLVKMFQVIREDDVYRFSV